MNQFSGVGILAEVGECTEAPEGFEDFTMEMAGDLEGCLYTRIITRKTTASGMYLESGQEIFVGSLNDGPEGTFTTTYRFEAKYAPDGSEIHGRCSTPSWTAAAPAASRVPAAGSTSKTTSRQRSSSTRATSTYAEQVRRPTQ